MMAQPWAATAQFFAYYATYGTTARTLLQKVKSSASYIIL